MILSAIPQLLRFTLVQSYWFVLRLCKNREFSSRSRHLSTKNILVLDSRDLEKFEKSENPRSREVIYHFSTSRLLDFSTSRILELLEKSTIENREKLLGSRLLVLEDFSHTLSSYITSFAHLCRSIVKSGVHYGMVKYLIFAKSICIILSANRLFCLESQIMYLENLTNI